MAHALALAPTVDCCYLENLTNSHVTFAAIYQNSNIKHQTSNIKQKLLLDITLFALSIGLGYRE